MPVATMNDPEPTQPAYTDVQFVVLHHRIADDAHYDLMIDWGEGLASWRCQTPPEEAGTQGLACRRIGHHRRAYLDYEGPVSRNRGHVARIDRGQCSILMATDSRWVVSFRGQRLRGRYALQARDSDRRDWLLTPDRDDDPAAGS